MRRFVFVTDVFMNRFALFLFVLLIAAAGAPEAGAQYMIKLSLDKKTFLSQEPMRATVELSNNSGSDVVMGGRGNSNWLSFHLEDATGRQYPPVGVEVEEPFVFKAGAAMKRQIQMSDNHAIGEIGTYAVTAVVYHAPTQSYYQSNRVRFTVTEVKAFWEQDFGVPQGLEDAGRVRKYSLHVLREDDGSRLYFRLTDDRSQMRVATYSLGPVSLALDPSFTMDSQNRLQVFFLAAPQVFVHCIIGPDGTLVSRKYFKEGKDNRPMLATRAGEIFVTGGIPFDPNAPAVVPQNTERSASQRPPGL
jgi:hypothetical protein